VVGRYVLTPAIFHHLRAMPAGAAARSSSPTASRAAGGRAVLAYRFEGRRYDCGSKLGYLEATVRLRPQASETGEGFAKFLRARQVTLNELRYSSPSRRSATSARGAEVLREPAALSVAIQKLEEELGHARLRARQERGDVTPSASASSSRRSACSRSRRASASIAQSGRNQLAGRSRSASSTPSRRTCCPTSSRRCTSARRRCRSTSRRT
jgi:hypothetical protein